MPSAAHMSAVCPRHCSLRVHVGAALDEQLLRDARALPVRAREHQRRLAVLVRRVDVGARVEQQLDELRIGDLHGFGERARAVTVVRVGLRAALQQQARRTATSSLYTAQCSGVVPSPCAALTSAPFSMSSSAASR